MIKLVAFDLWRTLAYRDYPGGTFARICNETGINIGRKEYNRIYEETMQKRIWNSKEEAYASLCRGLGINEENSKKIMQIRDEAESKAKLFPHVLPMLAQLRKSYKIGLISNTSVFAAEQLRQKTDLMDYIDFPVFSFDVGAAKPDPAIYLKALSLAGCKPEEAVMVGDSEDADVIAPRKLGMHAILYTDYESLKKDFAVLGIFLE
ncbi:MAG: HAD family hydrolase [Candidatus Anstonellales archaeon]